MPHVPRLAAAVAVAAAVAAWLASSAPPSAVVFPPPGGAPRLHLRPGAARRAAALLRFYTVSDKDAPPPAHLVDEREMVALHAALREQWPAVFSALKVTTIHKHSLLFEWRGTNASAPPTLLVSHLDVVPVAGVTHARGDGSAGDGASDGVPGWPAPPFGGRIVDVAIGDAPPTPHIVGRGALDVKCSAAAILEAVDGLLAAGFKPQASLYIAFGHDEEVGGRQGAAAITDRLLQDGVRFGMVVDEGGMVMARGLQPVITPPVALVGVAEKGYTSVEINATAPSSGHASMPPRAGAAAAVVAAAAAVAVDTARAPIVAPPTDAFVRAMGSVADSLIIKLAATIITAVPNWIARPILVKGLAAAPPSLAAMFGTTAAVVGIRSPYDAAAAADNVVPSSATVRLNYRLAPGDTPDAVLARAAAAATRAAAHTPITTTAAIVRGDPPSRVASPNAPPYRTLAAALADFAPEDTGLAILPCLMIAATDARHYGRAALSPDAVLRHQPVYVGLDDIARVHGAGERLSVEAYERAVQIYASVVQRACGEQGVEAV